jgi:hypothetical protein
LIIDTNKKQDVKSENNKWFIGEEVDVEARTRCFRKTFEKVLGRRDEAVSQQYIAPYGDESLEDAIKSYSFFIDTFKNTNTL